ncbi:MAG: 2-oxoacid:ferredoxin oxidoreductase subunit beta [bacterium]|nr:2-oxoacid:ferredoxin oxidoreductase subunit beta [bacterium]
MEKEETGNTKKPGYSAKDYKSPLKPIWCPGCGDFAVLNALQQSFAKLRLPRHKVAVISGIGCSSRIPGYLSTYGFNSLHGRAIPLAIGVKLANPDNTVVVAGGDGDLFSIGAGHMPHVARKNINLTVLAMDNRIYGLTKGQMSPTTPLDTYTSTTAYGSYDPPVNMVKYVLAYGAGFVARAFSGNLPLLTSLIMQGIEYKGFAFIQVLSPCVTYRGKAEYDSIRENSEVLPDTYDPTDHKSACEIGDIEDKQYLGLIYRNDNLIPYEDRIIEMRKHAQKGKVIPVGELINLYRT